MKNFDSSTVKKTHIFFKLYLIYVAMMIVNFFATPNPFSALHSGVTLTGGYVQSVSFFITPAYLVILSLIITLLISRQLVLNYKILILISLLLVSGLFSGAFSSNLTTYWYNILSLTLISSVSLSAYFKSNGELHNLLKIAKLLTLIMFLGIVIAVLFPYRYGHLPFDFSRYTRGEVTLWNVTGFFAIYPTMAMLIYKKYQKKAFIYFSLLMSVIVMSTATRADVLLTIMPFIIVLVINAKIVYKVIIGFFALLSLPFFYQNIVTFFLGANSNYNTDISNGRFELWQHHLNTSLENPMFGAGAFFIADSKDYRGTALSEVGGLMWFSENGIIFGIIMFSFVLIAIYSSIKQLSKGRSVRDTEFFFAVLFLSMLPNLVQSYGRILSIQDVLFWFSLFYINWTIRPKVPHIEFFNKNRVPTTSND